MYYVLCTMYIVFLTHGIKHFCIKYFMILNSDSKHNFLLVFNHSFYLIFQNCQII